MSPSHIRVLQDLKEFTDHTLPIIRERKDLGMEINSGTSMNQDMHYEKYIKMKFGIEEVNWHGEGTEVKNKRRSSILKAINSFEKFRKASKESVYL